MDSEYRRQWALPPWKMTLSKMTLRKMNAHIGRGGMCLALLDVKNARPKCPDLHIGVPIVNFGHVGDADSTGYEQYGLGFGAIYGILRC
jgi:hypothetical protein